MVSYAPYTYGTIIRTIRVWLYHMSIRIWYVPYAYGINTHMVQNISMTLFQILQVTFAFSFTMFLRVLQVTLKAIGVGSKSSWGAQLFWCFTINILTNWNKHTSLIQCWYTIHLITATGYLWIGFKSQNTGLSRSLSQYSNFFWRRLSLSSCNLLLKAG